MNMYRIILVDDEEEVRKGIIRKIQWEKLGFTIVGDAENGEDALEKIEQSEPNVVMTDIRMPYMDGLTLAERIRQKYPSMKILIFSGFDDFEYAQQAIKLNVTEYILKPVNMEELTEILTRVHRNLDEEIEQRRDVDLLRESYRSSLPLLREMFLNEMVRGNIPEAVIRQKLEEYQVDILGARKWLTAIIDVDTEEVSQTGPLRLHEERELIPISVRNLVEDHLKDFYRFAIFNTSMGITVIAAIDGHNTQTDFTSLLDDICKETRRILEVAVTIGIGHGTQQLENVGTSYQSAADALGYKAIVGGGKTIYINDMEPVGRGKLEFDGKNEADLAAAVKFGDQDTIGQVVKEIVGKMEDAKVHARQYQAYLLSIMNSMTRLMQQYDLNLVEMFGSQESWLGMLTGSPRGEEFTAWLTEVACRMNRALSQERDNTKKRVILDAKQYIQNHYQNPDLSVEMICRELHLSPAYFSTMFRKETGQTYVNYLTEIRLGQAVELLKTTSDKTYVIAQKVGYQEQNYFSYVFKKKFGVSPSKYRGT